MLNMLASAHREGYRCGDVGPGAGRACLGTYNPLPKALHGCDRRKNTAGGAEVWRRDGVGGRGSPRGVGGAVAALRRQCSADGETRTLNSTGRNDGGLRSTWATDACRDRSSLVLELSMMHGVGEEVERELAKRGRTAAVS